MPKTEPATAATPKPSPSSRKRTNKKPTPEKRLRRYRSKPPGKVLDRIHRALSQKMFLIRRGDVVTTTMEVSNKSDQTTRQVPSCEFVVLGSTGNVYTVRIALEPSCTCPDHAKGNLCKHIIFVLVKVMGLPSNSDLIYQQAWLSTELQHMFEIMSNRQVGGCATDVMANRKVQAKFAKLSSGNDDQEDDGDEAASTKRKSLDENADCPICFDEMSMDTTASASITFCRAACGSNFHATCMRAWLQQGSTTCPNCRQPWEDGSNKGSAATNKEGYTNLGNLQGQEAQRDESTYSEWYGGSPYHRRKKYRRRW